MYTMNIVTCTLCTGIDGTGNYIIIKFGSDYMHNHIYVCIIVFLKELAVRIPLNENRVRA